MDEKELIKKVVRIILYGLDGEDQPYKVTLTKKATKELANSLGCKLVSSIIDSELAYLILRHPDIFSLYSITADGDSLVKYRGKTIFYTGKTIFYG